MIYFDNNATTKIDPKVRDAMRPFFEENFGNPNSTHMVGQHAKIAVDEAREIIAEYINCLPVEVLFTGSATESNNWALKGVAEALHKKGNHIISTAIEHSSVEKTLKHLEELGFRVTYLPVNSEGHITIDDFTNAICDETILVTIQYANSEVGTLMPIRDIGKICQKKGIIFHTDATQAMKYLPLNVEYLHVNLMTFGAHKIHGPKGVAALYIKKQTPIVQFIDGGQQEFNLRAGTENVMHIAGFGEAVTILKQTIDERREYVEDIRTYFEACMQKELSGIEINGSDPRMVNISSIAIEGISSDTFLARLDMEGIYASAGSACTSGSIQMSPVLTAMGFDETRARATIRFSFSHENTREEVAYAVEKIKAITTSLRSL